MSIETLLDEAKGLIARSRQTLTDARETIVASSDTVTNETQRRKMTMSIETTSARAGELYAGGRSVAEVAAELNVTYAKARKLIKDSGTPVRDASARLKGRTRKIRS